MWNSSAHSEHVDGIHMIVPVQSLMLAQYRRTCIGTIYRHIVELYIEHV